MRRKCSCFCCRQTGHFATECPQRGGYSHPGASQTVQQSKCVNIESKQQCSKVAGATYLRARINGRVCDCLLDTGSDVTMIPVSFANDAQIRESKQMLTAANGTQIAVLGEVKLSLKVGKYSSVLTVLVFEHVDDVMLGIDWLESNNVMWDFSQSRIKIGKCDGLHA